MNENGERCALSCFHVASFFFTAYSLCFPACPLYLYLTCLPPSPSSPSHEISLLFPPLPFPIPPSLYNNNIIIIN